MKQAMVLLSFLLLVSRVDSQEFTQLHRFSGPPDGKFPNATLAVGGNMSFGVTRGGGSNDTGMIFRIQSDGADYSQLKSFSPLNSYPDYTNSDGAILEAGLTICGDTLFGTTSRGGDSGNGTVFKLKTDGSGFSVLKHFSRVIDDNFSLTNFDGAQPIAKLIVVGDTLYGTTSIGGVEGSGTIFRISTNGADYTVLKAFSRIPHTASQPITNADGARPGAGLVFSGGFLYGTTDWGGILGGGTVFKVNTNGAAFAVIKYLPSSDDYPYSNADGARPQADLNISGDVIYGTTTQGGTNGVGTLFRLKTDGAGFTVLKHFSQEDGWGSHSGVLLNGRMLFGTTYNGGSGGLGVIYRLNTNGTEFRLLKEFSPLDYPWQGAHPLGGLAIIGSTLYGTTEDVGGNIFGLELRTPLSIQASGSQIVLTWSDSVFALQSSPSPSGGFTNIPNALSPFTNSITEKQKFFRLQGY